MSNMGRQYYRLDEYIRTGSAVQVPDFTRGKWQTPAAPIQTLYCLDDVIDE